MASAKRLCLLRHAKQVFDNLYLLTPCSSLYNEHFANFGKDPNIFDAGLSEFGEQQIRDPLFKEEYAKVLVSAFFSQP